MFLKHQNNFETISNHNSCARPLVTVKPWYNDCIYIYIYKCSEAKNRSALPLVFNIILSTWWQNLLKQYKYTIIYYLFLQEQNNFEPITKYNSCVRPLDTVKPWYNDCIYIYVSPQSTCDTISNHNSWARPFDAISEATT